MRIFSHLLLWWIAISMGAPAAVQAGTPPAIDAEIRTLIEHLADPDPTVREQAATGLRQHGAAARPALVVAARHDHPAIAATATQILVSQPWFTDDDPPAIRTALQAYARPDPAQRVQIVRQIVTRYPRPIANAVLIRLLLEEPSEDVCWQIVASLRRTMDEPTHAKLVEIGPECSRASALVLAGRAAFGFDQERARTLLARAVEVETRRPSDDAAEMDIAFDALAGEAVNAGNFAEAARLRRVQSLRPVSRHDDPAAPVYRLFALHADYGPLEGIERDLITYDVYLAEPQVLHALARVYERSGQPLSAAAGREAAVSVRLTAAQRSAVVRFARRQHWDAEAHLELVTLASSPSESEQVKARLDLAELAAHVGDHAAAADHLSTALTTIEGAGLEITVTDGAGRREPFDLELLRTRSAWHRFLAAQAAGDEKAANLQLSLVVAADRWTTAIVVEAVPYLRSIGRDADAERIFTREYGQLRAMLAEHAKNAALLNEIAWLAARSGERPREALDFARQAVQIAPGEATSLDTLAEAHFQCGNFEDAVRIEQAVLDLAPTDTFMREQLTRFRAAQAGR